MSDRKEQGEERKSASQSEEDRKELLEDLELPEEGRDVKGGRRAGRRAGPLKP